MKISIIDDINAPPFCMTQLKLSVAFYAYFKCFFKFDLSALWTVLDLTRLAICYSVHLFEFLVASRTKVFHTDFLNWAVTASAIHQHMVIDAHLAFTGVKSSTKCTIFNFLIANAFHEIFWRHLKVSIEKLFASDVIWTHLKWPLLVESTWRLKPNVFRFEVFVRWNIAVAECCDFGIPFWRFRHWWISWMTWPAPYSFQKDWGAWLGKLPRSTFYIRPLEISVAQPLAQPHRSTAV